MELATSEVRAAGGIEGRGNIVVVDHTGDNNIVTFRFRFAAVAMEAAREAFEAGGRRFGPGSIVSPDAEGARLAPAPAGAGLPGYGVRPLPPVPPPALG